MISAPPGDKWGKMASQAWDMVIAEVRRRWEAGETQESLARTLGLSSKGVINQWLSGKKKGESTSFANLMRYMDALGQDPFTFLGIKRLYDATPTGGVMDTSLPKVPILTIGTGAGDEIEWADGGGVLPVLPEFYKPGRAAIRVTGDSMEPTIPNGAFIGIDRFSGFLKEGGIYVVFLPPFGNVVKRVHMGEHGEIVLISDNPKYGPRNIEPDGYEKTIVGEVRWVWHLTA